MWSPEVQQPHRQDYGEDSYPPVNVALTNDLKDLDDLEEMGGDQSMPPQMSGNPNQWQHNPKLQ